MLEQWVPTKEDEKDGDATWKKWKNDRTKYEEFKKKKNIQYFFVISLRFNLLRALKTDVQRATAPSNPSARN